MKFEDRACYDDACACNGGDEKSHCTHCRRSLPKSELTHEGGTCSVCEGLPRKPRISQDQWNRAVAERKRQEEKDHLPVPTVSLPNE